MKNVVCRHCRKSFGVPVSFVGDAKCPHCGRITPWPPRPNAPTGPALPPPTSLQTTSTPTNLSGLLYFGVLLALLVFAATVFPMLANRDREPSSAMLAVMVVSSSVVGLFVYFIPTHVAIRREHPNTLSIFVLNLFLGWSIFGWAASLAWACIALKRP